MSDAATSNVPEFSVSELSGAVKRTLEGAFGRVRVRGEITEFKRYPSGHLYFSLKDESAKISGIVWKSTVPRLGLQPENGVEVIATGRVTTYGERSSYQLIVERMEYAGVGALLARIELLKARLAAEGLFGADRKRALPLLPEVVGVVTSAAGAVLHDIRTTIERRFPRTVLLWPVPVQGEGAAAKIAAAIAGFGRLPQPGLPRPDVLIVARGGGSLEDLMAFNDEAVVRAAAACPIPLIAAVGHETDHTLIDQAADRRAPTPTAAAELAVPSRAELAALLLKDGARLSQGLLRQLGEQRVRLGRAERGLPDLPSLLGGARQRLDDRAERLLLSLPNLLRARRAALDRAERAIPDAPSLLRAARLALVEQAARKRLALPHLLRVRGHALGLMQLDTALRHAVALHRRRAAPLARLSTAPLAGAAREARTRLAAAAARLGSVSYENVLERGFTLVTDRVGHPLTRAEQIRPGAKLRLRFADAAVDATAAGSPVSAQLSMRFRHAQGWQRWSPGRRGP